MNWVKIAKGSGSQTGWTDTMGDVQRYLYDAYAARVYITNLAGKKITVSAQLNHLQEGTCMWQDFWRYEVNEADKARKTFNLVKEAIGKVFDDFKTNEIPNPMLHAYMRESVRHIDILHKPATRIPWVDWAKSKDCSADWRKNLYGNRYPETDGF